MSTFRGHVAYRLAIVPKQRP